MAQNDLEAAWHDHVGQLTIAQLASADASRAHLEKFQVKLVSDGLCDTPLCGLQDMHEMIASIIRDSPALDAKSMAGLMRVQREAFNSKAVQEIVAMVKDRALQGHSSLPSKGGYLQIKELKSFQPFMLTEGNEHGCDVIMNKLKTMGYQVKGVDSQLRLGYSVSW
eukprot:scaffold10853_cov54-Phaeocystis_antarctica.AAC.2